MSTTPYEIERVVEPMLHELKERIRKLEETVASLQRFKDMNSPIGGPTTHTPPDPFRFGHP